MLIVGGSYAAYELATSARENGYDEDIVIASEESELPYHRPPLSKGYLKGDVQEALPLKPAAFYTASKIDVLLGSRVSRIESQEQVAVLSNGTRLPFDTLALAVGARPRKLALPGADLKNVHYLRSVDDARVLKSAVADAAKLIVIGAGFIGLEVASAFVQLGKDVTVVEAVDRVLARVVAPEISQFFAAAHVKHGVKLVTSSGVQSLRGENGMVSGVILQDGTSLDADAVLVGIGSVPNAELAEELGLACRDGIIVDPQSRASNGKVFAAGDCARFIGPFNAAGIRLESVQNAIDQARVAGAVIAGKDKTYGSLPWFWSDQYDLKLQIAGLPSGARERVLRGGTDSEISIFHFQNDNCVCVESVNRPREHMSARRLLSQRTITKTHLQEVEFDLAALMKR